MLVCVFQKLYLSLPDSKSYSVVWFSARRTEDGLWKPCNPRLSMLSSE